MRGMHWNNIWVTWLCALQQKSTLSRDVTSLSVDADGHPRSLVYEEVKDHIKHKSQEEHTVVYAKEHIQVK